MRQLRTLVLALVVLESFGIIACFGGVTSLGGEPIDGYVDPSEDDPGQADARVDVPFDARAMDAEVFDASIPEASADDGSWSDARGTYDGGEGEGG